MLDLSTISDARIGEEYRRRTHRNERRRKFTEACYALFRDHFNDELTERRHLAENGLKAFAEVMFDHAEGTITEFVGILTEGNSCVMDTKTQFIAEQQKREDTEHTKPTGFKVGISAQWLTDVFAKHYGFEFDHPDDPQDIADASGVDSYEGPEMLRFYKASICVLTRALGLAETFLREDLDPEQTRVALERLYKHLTISGLFALGGNFPKDGPGTWNRVAAQFAGTWDEAELTIAEATKGPRMENGHPDHVYAGNG